MGQPTLTKIPVRTDCKWFRGDIPCIPNKERGRICEVCPEFENATAELLIIKLDAMGDVLRTTCVLEAILRQWPGARITWITNHPSVPLLQNISEIHEVVPSDHRALALLETKEFDVAFGLDTGSYSTRLTRLAKAREKRGFGLNERGGVHPLNRGAEEWFAMGIFDQCKKANRRTYQDLICQACELESASGRILFVPTQAEKDFATKFAGTLRLAARKPIVGLNIGAGSRWLSKRWPMEHWQALTQEIVQHWSTATVLLFGGPEEGESLPILAASFPDSSVVNTGSDNSVRNFAAILGLCDVIVTGDTLALHIALALRRRVVALFGPTASVEIELYNLGEKLEPPGGCDCFYRNECATKDPCLRHISASCVLHALDRQVESLYAKSVQ